MFPDCFVYSANGIFSPMNGIRSVSRPAIEPHAPTPRRTRRTTRRYKNRPAPHDEGQGENETCTYVRLSRTRKNEAPDKASKKEWSKENANGNANGDDENESDDGKHSPRKSADDADYLTEYKYRVFALGESEERDDEKNSVSNLRKTSENDDIHGDLPLVRLFFTSI